MIAQFAESPIVDHRSHKIAEVGYIAYSDIIPSTLKTIVFGYLIAVVSGHLGFTTSRGTEGVGEASTRAVVFGSMLIIVSDVVLVKIIFFFYPPVSG